MHVNRINSYYTNRINRTYTNHRQDFTFKSKPVVLSPVVDELYERVLAGYSYSQIKNPELYGSVSQKIHSMACFNEAPTKQVAYLLCNLRDLKDEKEAEIIHNMLNKLDENYNNGVKYDKRCTQWPNIFKMITNTTSKPALRVSLKMLEHPELLATYDSCAYINFFKNISKNSEHAYAALDVINRILINPKLFNRGQFIYALEYMLNGTTNQYKRKLALKILSMNPKIFDMDYFIGNLPGIIRFFPKGETEKAREIRKGVFERLDNVDKMLTLFSKKHDVPFDTEVDKLLDYYCELDWSRERDFPDPGEQEEWNRKCEELWD